MPWNPALSTGIENVDNQHKELIERVEEFLRECSKQKGHDVIDPMLEFLQSYVVEHFSHEEEMQEASGYTKISAHKRYHKDFVNSFLQLKARIEKEGVNPEITSEASKFLMNWIIEHINNHDKDFAAYYKKINK